MFHCVTGDRAAMVQGLENSLSERGKRAFAALCISVARLCMVFALRQR